MNKLRCMYCLDTKPIKDFPSSVYAKCWACYRSQLRRRLEKTNFLNRKYILWQFRKEFEKTPESFRLKMIEHNYTPKDFE